MIDDIFQKRPRKHTRDLNIVPILDALVTVIFFLLMSTTFIEYTKLSVPPASTVTAPADASAPPLAPKLMISKAAGDQYEIVLRWDGAKPGELKDGAAEAEILAKTKNLAITFAKQYPNEKTIQVSMGKTVHYQSLISAMDGLRDTLPDVVLSSYTQVETASP